MATFDLNTRTAVATEYFVSDNVYTNTATALTIYSTVATNGGPAVIFAPFRIPTTLSTLLSVRSLSSEKAYITAGGNVVATGGISGLSIVADVLESAFGDFRTTTASTGLSFTSDLNNGYTLFAVSTGAALSAGSLLEVKNNGAAMFKTDWAGVISATPCWGQLRINDADPGQGFTPDTTWTVLAPWDTSESTRITANVTSGTITGDGDYGSCSCTLSINGVCSALPTVVTPNPYPGIEWSFEHSTQGRRSIAVTGPGVFNISYTAVYPLSPSGSLHIDLRRMWGTLTASITIFSATLSVVRFN
jgi:hypothetical protein